MPQFQRTRFALAVQAHADGRVRLATRDLGAAEHLVTTARGLFAVTPAGHRLIAWGRFYGLTVAGDDVFVFEAAAPARARTRLGRLIRLRRAGNRIAEATVLATGFDNGCHGMDLIDGRLHLLDTYNQRLLRFAPAADTHKVLLPEPVAALGDWEGGYRHLNTIFAIGERRLLLRHNGMHRTEPSEVAVFDRNWRPIEAVPLAGHGCHSLAMLEDGTLLSCGSGAGELIGSDGLRLALGPMMTRGLSVGAGEIVVGGSRFAERRLRDDVEGVVWFLGRDYAVRATVDLPGPPMEIRRLDGQDRSLSAFVSNGGGTNGCG